MPVSSLAGVDETPLVAQSREGDTVAFGELVRRYEGKIFRLAQHVTQNREDAEDVLQETFMKAYEHLDQFQGNSKLYTWILRIAVNQALMKLRRRKTDKSVSLDEAIDTGEDTVVREIAAWDEDPEQRYTREELGTILDSAVQSLDPPYRTVFTLRDIDELSTEETAEALGVDEAGRPTAHEDGVELEAVESRGQPAELSPERPDVLGLPVATGQGDEVAVLAAPLAERDVEVERADPHAAGRAGIR